MASDKLGAIHHVVVLRFMPYNYCRIHKTLQVTPAMAANRVAAPCTVDDIVALVEKAQAEAAPRTVTPTRRA